MCTALVLMKLKQISFLYLSLGDWCDRCYVAYPAVLAFSNELDQISMFTSLFCQACVFLNPFKFREENKVAM